VITDALIKLVVTFVAPLLNHFLPHLTLGTLPHHLGTYENNFGTWLGILNLVIPVQLLFIWLVIFFTVLPAIAAYIAFQWVFDHLPNIFGWGTG
jgi:hypothetical protein